MFLNYNNALFRYFRKHFLLHGGTTGIQTVSDFSLLSVCIFIAGAATINCKLLLPSRNEKCFFCALESGGSELELCLCPSDRRFEPHSGYIIVHFVKTLYGSLFCLVAVGKTEMH